MLLNRRQERISKCNQSRQNGIELPGVLGVCADRDGREEPRIEREGEASSQNRLVTDGFEGCEICNFGSCGSTQEPSIKLYSRQDEPWVSKAVRIVAVPFIFRVPSNANPHTLIVDRIHRRKHVDEGVQRR